MKSGTAVEGSLDVSVYSSGLCLLVSKTLEVIDRKMLAGAVAGKTVESMAKDLCIGVETLLDRKGFVPGRWRLDN